MDEDDVGLTSRQHKHSKGIKLTQVKEYVATLSSKELRISVKSIRSALRCLIRAIRATVENVM